jgi:5,10-methylenetetrahydrofolate reductase
MTLVELTPPRGHVTEETIEQARRLRVKGVDAVLVPDVHTGARLSALSVAVLIQHLTGIDTVLQCSARDRSLLDLQSELLGAHAMGIRNVVLVTGDVPLVADYSDVTAVVDVDSIGLLNAVTRFNHGTDVGGHAIGQPTRFHVGVTVNPGAEDLEREMRRFDYKHEAGADFILCGPIFDVSSFERVGARLEASGLPIVLTVRPFESLLDAEYHANEVPGASVPGLVLDRLRRASSAEAAAAESVTLTSELVRALKGRVHGVHVVPPSGKLDLALAVLNGH